MRPAVRGLGFLFLWLVLFGFDAGSLPAGVVAAATATWTSLVLLPPGQARISIGALLRLNGRFVRQSALAGIDVARRAFDPLLPLRPGMVTYETSLPPGPVQSAFTALTSLVPGTVPSGTDQTGRLLVHCLDISQPVTAQMHEDEALLGRALGVAVD